MPLLSASLIEPLWVEFAALIGTHERPEFTPDHPWGCHRRRIPDLAVFDHLIGAFMHGSGYERLATPGCSDRTMRRRRDEWADAGHGPALLQGRVASSRPRRPGDRSVAGGASSPRPRVQVLTATLDDDLAADSRH